ncbi:FAD-binding domain-containing protein [Hahella ganghwensis]|uniref:FAD-binding domain-containing protein n=1 Tax=Hahella ganghwensis TaxID=286420 RepID=UPI0003640FE7|nr:FAD-binding domain-containing protein [Hahella ganghwensis]
MTLSVVWFKRDLRITDHGPLRSAAAEGPVLPIYVIESEYWQQPDTSLRQWQFIRESLEELNDQLHKLGQPLWVVEGDVEHVLEELYEHHGQFNLFSHYEVGNQWVRERNQRVAAWCRSKDINWAQSPSDGVFSGCNGRADWNQRWQAYMSSDLLPAPARLPFITMSPLRPEIWPDELGADSTPCAGRIHGGRRSAIELITGFLKQRSRLYKQNHEDCLLANNVCSHLGSHLTYGTLSMREVFQQTRKAHRHYKTKGDDDWAASLMTFVSQLLRRSHCMQLFADEPDIEHRPLHVSYEGLYPGKPDKQRLTAWMLGRTGFPLIDAGMRNLRRQGWVNQRMRQILISFACQTIWTSWREPALYLARMSTDYEPGVLYPQVQMQLGLTGIHPWSFEDPVNLAQKLDPEGLYIKAECPELSELEGQELFQPWQLSEAQQVMMSCHLGSDYPAPVVEPATVTAVVQHYQDHLRSRYDAGETQRILKQHRHPTLEQKLPVLALSGEESAQGYVECQMRGRR